MCVLFICLHTCAVTFTDSSCRSKSVSETLFNSSVQTGVRRIISCHTDTIETNISRTAAFILTSRRTIIFTVYVSGWKCATDAFITNRI